jgi:uncharacterized protein
MPTIFRVVLPVTDLAEAVRFYSALLGDDGERTTEQLHTFRFSGALLSCHAQAGHPPHPEPVYIAVEEPLHQVHYRAHSLGARHVDRDVSTLETGEHGFLVHDPFGNALYIVDQRSVAWQPPGRASQAPATIASADANAAPTLALQKDFINAVKGGDVEQVRELIEIEPDLIEADDGSGVSALMHAAYKQHHAVVDFLLQRNADLNLWEAAAFGQVDRLKHLIERGFRVNVFSPDGYTPLGLACFFGHPACVKLLLERGGDANLPSDNHLKARPLHSSVARASPEAALVNVRALIGAGADVNAPQKGGYTPLHQAADRGLPTVVKLLLSAGADRFAAAANSKLAADLARARGHDEIVALLK